MSIELDDEKGMVMEKMNQCLHCGACCAYYRVSFYWTEANDVSPGGVPVHLTERLNDSRRIMLGTNKKCPRCIALEGVVGMEVRCVIYEQRAAVCRDFQASWIDGVHSEDCDKARIAWNLQPLSPDSWDLPGNFPLAA